MSEYTGRYAGMSHRALYEAVRAGDPAQVDGLAAQWRSIGETTRRLADELTRDLGALARGWQGAAGEGGRWTSRRWCCTASAASST